MSSVILSQSQSPFFNLLPAEIRLTIYEHVCYEGALHMQKRWSPDGFGSSKLRTHPCRDPRTSQETHSRWVSEMSRLRGSPSVSAGDAYMWSDWANVNTAAVRHVGCGIPAPHHGRRSRGHGHRLLASCRRIYEEARLIPWQVNMHLFNTLGELDEFVKNADPQVVAALQRLGIFLEVSSGFDNSILEEEQACKLKGLKEIFLELKLGLPPWMSRDVATTPWKQHFWSRGVLPLQMLDLKRVMVIVDDSDLVREMALEADDSEFEAWNRNGRLTNNHKLQWARNIERMMLGQWGEEDRDPVVFHSKATKSNLSGSGQSNLASGDNPSFILQQSS